MMTHVIPSIHMSILKLSCHISCIAYDFEIQIVKTNNYLDVITYKLFQEINPWYDLKHF